MSYVNTDESNEDPTDDQPRTESLPVIEAVAQEVTIRPVDEPEEVAPKKVRPHRTPRHELDYSDEQNPQLIVTWYEKIRLERKSLPRYVWEKHVLPIDLDSTDLIDMRYAAKTHLTFSPAESRVQYLRRLHWMSHGPQQIMFGVLWILGLSVLIWLPSTTPEEMLASIQQWTVLIGLVWTIACASAVIREWMHWAYTYLICTDVRIVRIYYPPFKLPPVIDSAGLSKLQGCTAKSTWFGNILGYGTLRSATAANAKKDKENEVDSWLEDGIKYVPEYERLYAKLTPAE